MPEIDVDFYDPRISMEYWWPRISELDINTPETQLVSIEDIFGGGEPDFQPIMTALDSINSDDYFLRGDKKSADFLSEGGFLHNSSEEGVKYVMTNLMDSLLMSGFKPQAIAVREYLELDIIGEYVNPIPTEARVFIDEGGILCYHSRISVDDLENFDSDRFESPSQAIEYIEATIESEWNEIQEQAETIASEFDNTGWSIDFVRTKDGEWFHTDMALYGLYYFDLKEEGWKSLSNHESGCKYNLEENLPELPDEPQNPRKQ